MPRSMKSLYITLSLSSIISNLTLGGLASLSLDAVTSSSSCRPLPSCRGSFPASSSEFDSRSSISCSLGEGGSEGHIEPVEEGDEGSPEEQRVGEFNKVSPCIETAVILLLFVLLKIKYNFKKFNFLRCR